MDWRARSRFIARYGRPHTSATQRRSRLQELLEDPLQIDRADLIQGEIPEEVCDLFEGKILVPLGLDRHVCEVLLRIEEKLDDPAAVLQAGGHLLSEGRPLDGVP